MAKENIRVIALVEGGVVQAARASAPIDFRVLDLDNREGTEQDARNPERYPDAIEDLDGFEALEREYDSLPEAVY